MGCVLTALAAPLAGLLRRLILYFQSRGRLPDRNDSDNASVVTACLHLIHRLMTPACSALVLAKEKGEGKGKARGKGNGKGRPPSQVFAPAWLWMDMGEID